MNPGFHEDRANRPFVGPSGDLVRRVLLPGISLPSRATILLSNCARCALPAPDARPTTAHYTTCTLAHLIPELLTLSSLCSRTLLVLLGADPTATFHRLFHRRTLSLTRAFASPFRPYTIPLQPPVTLHALSTFHPAAVLRENNLIHAVRDHFTLLSDWLSGTLPTPSSPLFIEPRSPRQASDTSAPEPPS